MAQKTDPTINNSPTIPGNKKPGRTNTSTATRHKPKKKTRSSSCPAKPAIFRAEKHKKQNQPKSRNAKAGSLELYEKTD